MGKRKIKLVLPLLIAVFAFGSVFAGYRLAKNDSSVSDVQYASGEVPTTDLAATYKGKATDEDGNLLAPFDVVYPEAFESGDYEYDKSAALLKFGKNFDGKITKDLKSCGFKSLEKVTTTADGSSWYRAALNGKTEVKTAVKKARSLKTVLTADFDYIYEDDSTEVAEDNSSASSSDLDGLIDDVLSNIQVKDQWYLTACDIQKSWRWLKSKGISAGGDPSVTVAVIDTGVDYTHPDLKANMWVNPDEIPGNGIDDDGDGYIDDVYGCSTVSDERFHSGDPMDDHGHGTHVAGIIAAANNKVGTVGVAYNVKIMAIKAGQATGIFLQSDIAEAIVYAYTHGADVINMSFGGSACSIAVQDALQSAYTTSTLVAAAGNENASNELSQSLTCPTMPNYPAALSYVVGVMSVNALGVESSFTNWDVKAYNSVEYEVYAPGEAMLSTLPNNRYGKLNGTSMATPVVSGIAALLRSYYTDRDTYPSKFVSAQLCATSEDSAICFDSSVLWHGEHNLPMIVNAYSALTKLPKPDVNLYGHYLFDGEDIAEGNNGDGVIDAGETVNIGTVLRNRWGMSKNTVVSIDALSSGGIANPYVEIITGSVEFDGVGTYSTKDNLTRNENGAYSGVENPLVVKIAKDCPNDYVINLNVTVTFGNGLDERDSATYTTKGLISFSVRNGVVLPSKITEDMTLTNDNYYIVRGTVVIEENVRVTISRGTKIQFWTDLSDEIYLVSNAKIIVKGTLIADGTENDMVELFPNIQYLCVDVIAYETGFVQLNYTKVVNPQLSINETTNCMFCSNGIYSYRLDNSVLQQAGSLSIDRAVKCSFDNIVGTTRGKFDTCVFTDCGIDFGQASSGFYGYQNCVFNGNTFFDEKGVANKSEIELTAGIAFPADSVGEIKKFNDSTYFTFRQYRGWQFFDNFVRSIGGNLCCIETLDEWQFISSEFNKCYVGMNKDKKTWVNGEEVNNFMQIEDGPYESATLSDGIISFAVPTNTVLYEIPTMADSSELSKEVIKKLFFDFMVDQPDDAFKCNVVLNNLNLDKTQWMLIKAFDIDSQIMSLTKTYWGTSSEEFVLKQIVDSRIDPTRGTFYIGDFSSIPENTFPFVTDAYVINSNGERARTVSNETCTFVVEFNRDMDTTVPLRVRFGSSTPYAEYEISGKFVSARRWEGVYTLKTTIENGNQYFNIDNARAADDHFMRLYETLGRFGFEIDTTAAQAMIMQGEATETGVKLTWQQDDFDTLLGYNVYRSDKEDGLYTRLNDYVLAADENEFFDSTVEPGKLYYYNFTVVKTDMQESTPSGKIVIRAMDTMAPNIYHSPVRTAYTGQKLIISATITDNLQITSATLYYRASGGEWKSYAMYNNNSRYYGIVGAESISLDGLEYYIDAFDGVTHTYNGTKEKPYLVTVKVAVDDNSLGDVDGDGVITNKDALMLLQAANDKLNLTEEQFMRADIDKDGVLSAAEAMRILQYVSGKIGSIV